MPGLSDGELDDPLANVSITRMCGGGVAGSVAAASATGGAPPTPLSPRELRQLVVNELIHTEQSYFRDLSLVVEVHAFVHARACACAVVRVRVRVRVCRIPCIPCIPLTRYCEARRG
jgi:hypothetical protein